MEQEGRKGRREERQRRSRRRWSGRGRGGGRRRWCGRGRGGGRRRWCGRGRGGGRGRCGRGRGGGIRWWCGRQRRAMTMPRLKSAQMTDVQGAKKHSIFRQGHTAEQLFFAVPSRVATSSLLPCGLAHAILESVAFGGWREASDSELPICVRLLRCMRVLRWRFAYWDSATNLSFEIRSHRAAGPNISYRAAQHIWCRTLATPPHGSTETPHENRGM